MLATILKQPCIWYCRTFNPSQKASSLKSIKAHETNTVKENTTCAVCMVFVLQYLSTSQLQGEKINQTPLQRGWGVQENMRERETGKKKRLYSRIQLMLKAPQLHNKYRLILKESPHRNIAFLPVLISCGTCTWWHCNDQRKEGKKLKYNRRATFVPFFTAELGRWRSEDTLLRNCKKPWFLF